MIVTLALAQVTPEQTRVIAVVILMLGAFTAAVLYPMARAWARRLERETHGGASPGELEALRNRVIDLESQVARVQELEERVEFAERLLARSRAEPGPPTLRGETE